MTDAAIDAAIDPAAFIRANTRLIAPPLLPEMQLYLGDEVTPLWQATEDMFCQTNLPPPFWAFAWPGGQGVARYVLDHPETVCGKKVVDFAAGSGLGGIAAMKAGARDVLCVDIDHLALQAIELNAAHNGAEVTLCDGLDLTRAYKKADVILAGDICYQQATSTSVTRWLRLSVDAGVTVFLADPGRAYVPDQGLIPLAAYVVPTSRDLEDSDQASVTVWRMEKIASE